MILVAAVITVNSGTASIPEYLGVYYKICTKKPQHGKIPKNFFVKNAYER